MKHLKKVMLAVLLCAIFFVPLPTTVQAAEKQVQVELDKDYEACLFRLTFAVPGTYTATLNGPDGSSYEFGRVDDQTMTYSLEKVKKGAYAAVISTESDNEIGTVTMAVTANNVSSTNIVSDNIRVGKDISGLKMYFKDDSFIAEWTDETCGAVEVKVVNLDTAETLKNEKVTDKKFECELNSYVKHIVVSIVPSSSSNIAGAELTYNFDCDYAPDAVVTFPEQEKTNSDKLAAKVILGDSYSVYVEDNEECVLTTDTMLKGTYDIAVPLAGDGRHDIRFYIVDGNGNMRSTSHTVHKDTVAPSLSLTEEYDGMEIHELSYTISGTVTNYDEFQINNKDVKVSTDGYFEKECSLHWGENKIHIIARDDAGNATEYHIVIRAVEKQETGNGGIVAAAVCVIGFAFMFFKKRKNKKTQNADVNPKISKEDTHGRIDVLKQTEEADKNRSIMEQMIATLQKWIKKPKEEDKPDRVYENDEDPDESICEEDAGENLYDDEDGDETEAYEYEAEDEEDDLAYISEEEKPVEECGSDPMENEEELFIHGEACTDDELYNREENSLDNTGENGNETDEDATHMDKEVCQDTNEKVKQSPSVAESIKVFMKRMSRKKRAAAHADTYDTDAASVEGNDQEVGLNASDAGDMITGKDNVHNSSQDATQHPQTVINIITDNSSKWSRKQKKRKHPFLSDLCHCMITVGFVYAIFHFILLHGFVSSPSMEETLKEGDCTIANRLAYKNRLPERGDIIFFEKDGELICKRVIGVPGDRITFEDGQVLIDDGALQESYLKEEVHTFYAEPESGTVYEVPEGCVFVLGDNRENSYDSRYWEDPYLPVTAIRAKLIVTVPLHFLL